MPQQTVSTSIITYSVVLLCFSIPFAYAIQPGDINRDDVVNMIDLSIVGSQFNVFPISDPRADVNKDGRVDLFDIVAVTRFWGNKYAPFVNFTTPIQGQIFPADSSLISVSLTTDEPMPRTWKAAFPCTTNGFR